MKAVIARSDLLTACGQGIEPLWNALLANRTAIKTSEHFANRGFTSNLAAQIPDLPIVPGQSRCRAMLDRLLKPLIGTLDPGTTLILASTVCEIEFVQRAIAEQNIDLAEKAKPHHLLAHVKSMLGLSADAMVFSSACASSSAAVSHAALLVETKQSTAVLVVACDGLSDFVYGGFSTLMSLCDTPARPFDAGRCGLSLGEAAAWALITPENSPLANKDSLAILGFASTTDAIHMTAPDRTANGLSNAIQSALQSAQVQPEDIALIAAHGTATVYNDAMELAAFHRRFSKPIPTFSIKGAIGHTLAVAGLTQVLTIAHAFSIGIAPPTVGFETPDPNAADWVHNTPMTLPTRAIALSTNSGFGGVNTALVLGPVTNAPATPPQNQGPIHLLCVSWFTPESCGYITAGKSFSQAAPSITATKEMTDLIGRQSKYFSRMTPETRAALAATSLTVKALEWDSTQQSLGIIGSGFEGCIAADVNYYQDFISGGSSVGRANLFIYTLPTSALSEVAIALNLTGPTRHLHYDSSRLDQLIQHAIFCVKHNQADGILALFTDTTSAVCIGIGPGRAGISMPAQNSSFSPGELARQLTAKARRA